MNETIKYVVVWTLKDVYEYFSNRDNLRTAILYGYAPANLLMVALKALGL